MTKSDSLLVEFVKQRDIKIEDLDLSARAYNMLRANGFRFLSDFICFDYKQLKWLDYMSGSVAREIDNLRKDYLREHRDEIRLAVSEASETAVPVPETHTKERSDAEKNDFASIDVSEKPLQDVLYKNSHTQSSDVMSLSIDGLGLSTRAYNCLRRAKINTIGELLQISQEGLYRTRNIGRKTADEIMHVLAWYLGELSLSPDAEEGSNVGNSTDMSDLGTAEDESKGIAILSDDRPIDALELSVRSYNALIRSGICTVQQLMNLERDDLCGIRNLGQKSLDELDRIRREYQPPFEIPPKTDYEPDELIPLILDAFSVPFKGLSFQDIKGAMPKEAKDEAIKKAIGALLAEHKIEYVDFRCYKVYPSFSEAVESFSPRLKDRDGEILQRRSAGERLEEIAQSLGITRERVRQIYAKSLRKMRAYWKQEYGETIFSEDFYSPLFTKYALLKSFWEEELALPQKSILYLSSSYDSGTLSPENALGDEEIPVSLRYRLRSFLDRDKIRIDGILFPRSRYELENYALRKYAQEELAFDRFCEFYNGMLEANGIPFDEKLYYTEGNARSRINRLADSMFCLWKQGERLRYYDIQSRDYTDLLERLQLNSFHDTEFSALKLMRQYPELMATYDIRDAYELHNLLKKIAASYHLENVVISRQPMLQFGDFDRNKAIMEIIEAFSPLTREELIEYLADEFGYQESTMLLTYLPPFDQYLHNGVYSVDFKRIPEERQKTLQAALVEDFYYIDELRKIYVSLFANADPEEINPYTLKKMGFLIRSDYAIQNFPTAAAFFTDLLTKSDVYDISDYQKQYGSTPAFSQALAKLLSQHSIFLFEKKQIISMRKLSKLGVTEELIQDYFDSVQAFAEEDTYFTVYSLRDAGFTHALDRLGFEDYFYSMLLTTDSRFGSQSFFGNTVFYNGNTSGRMSKAAFLQAQLREYESVDPDVFVEDMEDRFSIHIPDRYEILNAIRDTELYYDSIMDKVYCDKSTYYADFDE